MSNVINKSEIKIHRKGAASAETGITLYISNEDLNYIIQIIKLSEDLGVLIDAYTETVKRQIIKKNGGFLGALLAPLATSIVQPVISSLSKGLNGKGYIDENF